MPRRATAIIAVRPANFGSSERTADRRGLTFVAARQPWCARLKNGQARWPSSGISLWSGQVNVTPFVASAARALDRKRPN